MVNFIQNPGTILRFLRNMDTIAFLAHTSAVSVGEKTDGFSPTGFASPGPSVP